MSETVLVTGAFGFLGRHVARACANAGHRVFGLGYGRWAEPEWRAWGLAGWTEAEVCLPALRELAGKPDILIHCAGSGSVRATMLEPERSFRNTVTSTVAVLDYVAALAPESRVVFASSASVYGEAKRLPIEESVALAPVSAYGRHKLEAEQHLRRYGRERGVASSIVRLFSVYGCGLRKQLLWDTCVKLEAGDPVFQGSGDELRDWLHVEDAAALMLSAAHFADSVCPTVNGGSGIGVAVREVVTRLGTQLLGVPFTPIFDGTRREGDPMHFVADLKASARWQWQPSRAWEHGVDEYADWWQRTRPYQALNLQAAGK